MAENIENMTNDTSLTYDVIDEMGVIAENTKILGNIETLGHLAIAGTVEGDISAKGNVIITGIVKGNIKCDNLVLRGCNLTTEITATGHVAVEENVTISGKISCKTIVVNGAVTGNITAEEKVALSGQAQVKGNIKTASFGVEFGAKLNGNLQMV